MIKFENKSNPGGNNKPQTNEFVFTNSDGAMFSFGEEVYFTTPNILGSNVKTPILGVHFKAKDCMLNSENAKRIFMDYLKIAHDDQFYNDIPNVGVWQQVKLLYFMLRTLFPIVNINFEDK